MTRTEDRRKGKIISSADMLKAALGLKRRGKIPPPPPDPTEALERARQSRASLAVTGNPLAHRPTPEIANLADPTPQWIAKAGRNLVKTTVGRGELLPLKQHRIKHPIEQHGPKFPVHVAIALARCLEDGIVHQRISTSNWNRSGGFEDAGSRLGGLGAAPQKLRDAHARHQFVMQHLNEDLRDTALTLVLRELTLPEDRPFGLEDFGEMLFPSVRDTNTRKGISLGMLRALGTELSRLYRHPSCPRIRPIDERPGRELAQS